MVMCSAQRNKKGKEEKMWTIYVGYHVFFWSLEGSIGQHAKYSKTWENFKNDE